MDALQVVRSKSSEAAEIIRSKSREVVEVITGPQEPGLLDPCAAGDDWEGVPGDADSIPVEAKPIELLTQSLAVNPALGLTPEAAKARLEVDGPNELTKTQRPKFMALFVVQLLNPIILLLIGAAAASLAVNSTTTAAAILFIVLLNAGIAAATENSAGSALEALSNMSQPEAQLLRDGVQRAIPSKDIVCGDVVILGVGDVVPADIRLLEASDLKVNEMPLTGESEDVSKSVKLKAGEKGTK